MTINKCAKSNNKISLAEPTKKPDVIYVEEIEAPVEPPPPPPPQAPKEYKVYTYKTTTPKDADVPPSTPKTPKPLSGDLVYQSEPSEPVKVFKFEPHDAKPNTYFKNPSTAPAKLREEPGIEPGPAELEEPYFFNVPTTETIYHGQEIFPEDVTNTLSEFDAIVASDGEFGFNLFRNHQRMYCFFPESPE